MRQITDEDVKEIEEYCFRLKKRFERNVAEGANPRVEAEWTGHFLRDLVGALELDVDDIREKIDSTYRNTFCYIYK